MAESLASSGACVMVGLSNTVSPMRTMLPGEPLSPAQSNAAAKVAAIAGAYQVQRCLDQMFLILRTGANPTPSSSNSSATTAWNAKTAAADCHRGAGGSLSATRISALKFAAVLCRWHWSCWSLSAGASGSPSVVRLLPAGRLRGNTAIEDMVRVICRLGGPDQHSARPIWNTSLWKWFVARS